MTVDYSKAYPTALCSVCGRLMRLLKNGTLGHHSGEPTAYRWATYRCAGVGKPPAVSDRDDLVATIAVDFCNPGGSNAQTTVDAILAAGWRRSTVTAKQIRAAESVFGAEYHNLIVGVAHQFGLTVAEDGEVEL